ncbi:MAG: pyridoxal phosphate-dependent aminotransferase [Deltaproteobacteria bacterium]|nr:pyridoxal phosphate-dependent aminotransferase [Deltaproteobacteria bacterium]
MPVELSKRIKAIKPSPTLAITAKANALKAQGVDIIGFGAGEPDFDTPANIKQAAIGAINGGFTRYTAVGGTDALKDAIISKLNRDSVLSYRREQICVSCGAKHSLYNLFQVLCEEGDEVIIPVPYWVSYPDLVTLTGARPVILSTAEEDGFKVTPQNLEALITSKTKALVLNSPSNPTGCAYTDEELRALARVLIGTDIQIISDDIYEKLLYDGAHFCNLAMISETLKNQTIVVNGVSKAYAMTGWRIGYAAGNEEIISAMTKLQSQNTSNPTSIAQVAAQEALNGSQDEVYRMRDEFQNRRNYIVKALNAIDGVSCLLPAGAFYVFPNVSRLYGKSFNGKEVNSSAALTEFLLTEAKVAVVPGGEFGSDHHIRLSYATSMENIEKGVARIKEALGKLR